MHCRMEGGLSSALTFLKKILRAKMDTCNYMQGVAIDPHSTDSVHPNGNIANSD
jgi:hypothetical protein